MDKNYKYLGPISVFFVSVLLISNVASTKIVDLKWFVFDAGTLLFPLSYIFGDILTEVYGYKRSRSVIWLGFFMALMMSAIFIVEVLFTPITYRVVKFLKTKEGEDYYDTNTNFNPFAR